MPKFDYKNLFHFTNSEKRGAVILVAIILVEIIFLIFQPFQKDEIKVVSQATKDSIAAFSQYISKEKPNSHPQYAQNEVQNIKIILKPFNPNTADYKTLVSLGISPKVAHIIENYRQAGGKFYEKSDLKNIYGLSAVTYKRIKSYIKLPKDNKSHYKKKNYYELPDSSFKIYLNKCTIKDLLKLRILHKYQAEGILKYRKILGGYVDKIQLFKVYQLDSDMVKKIWTYIRIKKDSSKININAIDSAQLDNISGVSTYLTKSMLKFRKMLGGFVNTNQIYKVYGMDSIVAIHLIPRIYIDSSRINRINLNKATEKELSNQYYISKKTATKIINFRDLHGKIQSPKTLLTQGLITPKLYRKIAPYLTTK